MDRTICPTCRRETLTRDREFVGRLRLSNRQMLECGIYRCSGQSCQQTVVFGRGEGPVLPWPKLPSGLYDEREVVPAPPPVLEAVG